MDSFLSRYRNSIVLAVVLSIQLLGLAMQIKRHGEDGEIRLLRLWAISAITPIEKAVVHGNGWAHATWSNYINVREVRRQNESLKEQLEHMRLQQVRLQEDANQARRIQSLLAFKEQFVSKTIAAQVIGTSGSDLSRIIYIDRGSNDGIKPNLPVITPEGIVGKVIRVYGSTSQVLQVNDQTSGVGAILVNSRLQGIVKGSPNGEVTLNYIMADEKVSTGDQLVTSGGDRIFPKGLPIGVVEAVSMGRDSFLNLRVRPAANLNKLEEVLVITEVDLKEPDTKDRGPIRAADILAERLPSVPPKPDPNQPTAQQGQTATGTPNQQGSAPAQQTTPQPAAQQGTGTGITVLKPASPKPSPTGTATGANTASGATANKPAGTSANSVKPTTTTAGSAATTPKPASTSQPHAGTAASTPKPKSETKPTTTKPATEAATPQGH